MWRTCYADVYLSLSMADRAVLEIAATVKFKYRPGSPATWDDPADGEEVDAAEVVSISLDHGGGKLTPLPLTKQICNWITESVDPDTLIERAREMRREVEEV